MPYIVLIAGALIAAYALYRFLIRAEIPQIRKLVYLVSGAGLVLLLLFFAMTGRILIALVLVVLLFPFFLPYFRKKKNEQKSTSGDGIIDVTPESSEIHDSKTSSSDGSDSDSGGDGD